ncbi:MAG: molybdopterin-dependent oxidoreductase, partial [Actinomadura rubrobrunea]|nr:molybdopterin-dependent oxidoreductase [Actinomadura rubrobrunea]
MVDLAEAADAAYRPTPPPRWGPADTRVGDVEEGLARGVVRLRRHYTTAARHHVPLEPSATMAEWRDGTLTVYDATQGVFNVRTVIAEALGLPIERVRVIAHYTGGGFGAKGYVWPHQLIAAMTARALGGAVRLTLTRAQTFTSHGYQPPTRQTVELAATAEGRLTALRHESLSATAAYGEYVEMAATVSRVAYACPAIETTHRVAPVATILPTPMRAPHEGTGTFALESAMDELAYEIGMDPLELRLRNYAEADPTTGKPFSTKRQYACYWEGAKRFGWEHRPFEPRSLREGTELIGKGMAGSVMTTFRFPAAARARLHADGTVVIEAGCQEIGTGAYTVLSQIAAETLNCSVDQVTLRLGDTALPQTGMTAGSSTTLSVGSAVQAAARALAVRLGAMVGSDAAEATAIEGGALVVKNGPVDRVRLAELFARHGVDSVTAEGRWSPAESEYSMHSFGAVFAEVGVDEELCLIRV